MKTAYLKESGKSWSIRVVVWENNAQREYFASSHGGAMRIVDERHRNAHSPAYYDREGRELYDNGVSFEHQN